MLNPSTQKSVCVMGLGYIGLPTAAAFTSHGIKVIGVDVNPHVVETINRGEIHIVEPGLEESVHWAMNAGLLWATLKPEPADTFLIAVPTPLRGENHEPDLSYIRAAALAIAPVLTCDNLVVLESTSPIGATEQLALWLAEARPDLSFPQDNGERSDIRIAHCPERVLPGKVMHEIIVNDRIIGGMTPRCGQAAKNLYEIFVTGEIILTDVRTAEMCKLAENAFRDVNIAYANELSLICDKQGIDVRELIYLANRHPRVNILQPGPGVGGHCIAVDPWFIISGSPDEAKLIHAARTVNDGKPKWVQEQVARASDHFSSTYGGALPLIAVLGLAFKPNIDDLRESPALHIAEALRRRHGDRLIVVEPHIVHVPPVLEGTQLVSIEAALSEADIIVVLVHHDIFEPLTRKPLRLGQQVIDVVGLLSGQWDISTINRPRSTMLAAE